MKSLKRASILFFVGCTVLFMVPYVYSAVTALWIGTVAHSVGSQTVNEPKTWFHFGTDGHGAVFNWSVDHKIQRHFFWFIWTDAGTGNGNHGKYVGNPNAGLYYIIRDSKYEFNSTVAGNYRFRSEAHSKSDYYELEANKNSDWEYYTVNE